MPVEPLTALLPNTSHTTTTPAIHSSFVRLLHSQKLHHVVTFHSPRSSHCLRAAAFYVRGLFSFFQGRYNEAK